MVKIFWVKYIVYFRNSSSWDDMLAPSGPTQLLVFLQVKKGLTSFLLSTPTCCSEAIQASTCTHFRLGNSVSCIRPYTPSSSSPYVF